MKNKVSLKKILHVALLADLVGGTAFAWYNSAKEAGMFGSSGAVCGVGPASMLGLPICVWGAIFFTVALGLAVALWLVKE